jgi:hypothetical protein
VHWFSVFFPLLILPLVLIFISFQSAQAKYINNVNPDTETKTDDRNTEALNNDSSEKNTIKDIQALTLRPDQKRPEKQLTITLFGRPLTIGGEYDLRISLRRDFRLDSNAEDDVLQVVQEFEHELLYDLTENIKFFLEINPFYRTELYAEDGSPEKDDKRLKRGQTWIYFKNVFGSDLDLQVGRQGIDEKREWWWNKDLDAARIHYKSRKWRLELGIAEELAKDSFEKSDIDPEDEDILRVLGKATWKWAKRQRVGLFFLYQDDHSRTESPGRIIDSSEEDESDADLFWIGLRSTGRWKDLTLGRFRYWLDTAIVTGEESLIDYDSENGGSVVDEIEERDVSGGWSIDAGITWQTTLHSKPSITLGYAVGSGDRDPDNRTDRSFRQTGLHKNNGRFWGVDSFRYYGELLRPELSNLHVLTISAGLSLLRNSSVEVVYHRYWQDHAAAFMRDARIKAKPLGKDNDIGQEWNVVVGIEEWKHVELELVAALFRSGNAYGSLSGENAGYMSFGFTYNF